MSCEKKIFVWSGIILTFVWVLECKDGLTFFGELNLNTEYENALIKILEIYKTFNRVNALFQQIIIEY